MEQRRVIRLFVIVNSDGQELQDSDGDTLVFDTYMEAVQFSLVHSFQLAGCKVMMVEN
jgi:hypothetical protein